MRALFAAVIIIAAGAALPLACTSSDPTPVADANTSSACRLTGSACLASSGACCAQRGNLFDESRGCVAADERVIGCAPAPISTAPACAQQGVVGCAITVHSGVRQVWFTAAQTPGWSPDERCADALATQVTAFKACE